MSLRLTQAEYDRLIARRQGKPLVQVDHGRRWEVEMAAQLNAAGLKARYVREHRFLQDRRFRFDFAFIPERFAVEVDGAVHRIKKRFRGDQEKSQLAMLGGWKVLHVRPEQVRNGEAIALVIRLLNVRIS